MGPKVRKREEQPAMKLILMELESGPACDTDLAHILGLHRKTVKLYTKLLWQQQQIVPLWWERKQGGAQPVWGIKNGNNMGLPKPRAMTRAEGKRRQKARMKGGKKWLMQSNR
jgi:hypothetical protein